MIIEKVLPEPLPLVIKITLNQAEVRSIKRSGVAGSTLLSIASFIMASCKPYE